MFMITRFIYITPYINIIGAIWYSIISNIIYDYLDDNRLLVKNVCLTLIWEKLSVLPLGKMKLSDTN